MIDKMIIMIKWSPDLRSAASDGLAAQFVWRQSPERSAGSSITRRILTQGASDWPDQSEAGLVTRRPIRSQDSPRGLVPFHVWTRKQQPSPSSAVRRSSGCRYRGRFCCFVPEDTDDSHLFEFFSICDTPRVLSSGDIHLISKQWGSIPSQIKISSKTQPVYNVPSILLMRLLGCWPRCLQTICLIVIPNVYRKRKQSRSPASQKNIYENNTQYTVFWADSGWIL